MTAAKSTDSDFIALFEKLGPGKTAKRLGVDIRNVHRRRETLEAKLRRQIVSPRHGQSGNFTRVGAKHPDGIALNICNGHVLIGSDAHIWPGPSSTAMRGFVQFCKELKPRAVVLNGDMLDGATISRHPPIGWEGRPRLIDEIEAAQEQLSDIEKALPKTCERIWTLGNHDSRLETRIATMCPEFAKVHGVHLRDHFPGWRPSWLCHINDSVVVKHRYKGGDHAPYNNVVKSGRSIVTGHLHSAQVRAFTDYNGTRWGVDAGCMAETSSKAFLDYTEGNPKDWRSAFVVLKFINGVLLQPQLALVHDRNHIDYCGELIRV